MFWFVWSFFLAMTFFVYSCLCSSARFMCASLSSFVVLYRSKKPAASGFLSMATYFTASCHFSSSVSYFRLLLKARYSSISLIASLRWCCTVESGNPTLKPC